jgi:hypothetical protein
MVVKSIHRLGWVPMAFNQDGTLVMFRDSDLRAINRQTGPILVFGNTDPRRAQVFQAAEWDDRDIFDFIRESPAWDTAEQAEVAIVDGMRFFGGLS